MKYANQTFSYKIKPQNITTGNGPIKHYHTKSTIYKYM